MLSNPGKPTQLFLFADKVSSLNSATEMKNQIWSKNAIQIFDACFRFFNIVAACPFYFRLDSSNQIECVAPVIAIVSPFSHMLSCINVIFKKYSYL